jgi:hypothetical protein
MYVSFKYVYIYSYYLATTTSSIAIHDFFRDKYAPFIIRRDVKIISWIGFLIYFMLSIYGCANIKVDISPRKYIRDDSPIQQFLHLAGLLNNLHKICILFQICIFGPIM